ncbi:MAG: amino acid synthesis family protein [Desulfobacteraceae bacterium]|nr:amino acid synthesis family protein [Desulfobacteraceae bacterium]
MELEIRKSFIVKEKIRSESGIVARRPLCKVAAVVVVKNPYAGRHVEDLAEAVAAGEELGDYLGEEAVNALKEPAESYGKGGIVGINGEMDHANMFLTTEFARGLRKAVGGGAAWIPSASKLGGPGTAIDIPMAYKDALFVRSHYDAMEVRVPDAPLPDEVAVIAVVANRGRLNYRLGGLSKEEATGKDGLR